MSERVTRKDALVYGGAAVGGLVAGGAAVVGVAAAVEKEKAAVPVEGSPIVAPFVDGDLPAADPASDVWDRATAVLVPLGAQQIAQPFLEKTVVTALEARALHNGTDVALLLEWDDDSVDDLDGIRRYHDAAAVQIPTTPGAAPALTMGAPGVPVHILQWRATW
jgi:DMSO reductase family type II enzyme heme b subunit